jgi:putative flippase GtrA
VKTAPPARPSLAQWLRHHVASIVATAVDYGVMVSCVELLRLSPVAGTALGATAGALTNFTLGRLYTYGVGSGPVAGYAWRYAIVSGASLAWNAGGEALFHDVLGMQYLLARVLTSIVVSNAWNYPLQRYFVFSRRSASAGAPRA